MTTEQQDWLDDRRAAERREAIARATRGRFWATFSRSNPRMIVAVRAYRLRRTFARFRGLVK